MAAPFTFISEGGMSLTSVQADILSKIEGLPFVSSVVSSIGELRSRMDYQVVISDRASFLDNLNKEIKAVENLTQELLAKANANALTEEEKEVLGQELLWDYKKGLESAKDRIENGGILEDGKNIKTNSDKGNGQSLVLLGLYRSWDFSYNTPTIYLFKENIYDYASRKRMNPDNVFAFVYVHEAMHAFYDMDKYGSGLRVRQLEEPFAEFGMLTFLTSAVGVDQGLFSIASDASTNVEEKQIYGPFEYGFGLAMTEIVKQYDTEGLVNRYREVSDRIWGRRNFGNVQKYTREVEKLRKAKLGNDTQYKYDAQKCFVLVAQILNEDWNSMSRPQASIFPILEPHARKEGIVSKRRKSIVRSRAHIGSLYCTVCEPGYRHTILHPLFSGARSSDILAIILQIIKNQGIDRKLSIGSRAGRTIAEYLGTKKRIPLCVVEPVSRVSQGDPRYIHGAKLNINGMDYIPARVLGYGVGIFISDAVQVLSDWFGMLFTVVSDSTGMVTVYGPGKIATGIFMHVQTPVNVPLPQQIVKTSGKDLTRYELTDLQGNIIQNLSKAKLAWEVLRSFVESNPGLTIAQLQAEFPQSFGGWGPKNILEVVKPVTSIPKSHDDRFSADVLSASDGDFRVSTQWNLTSIGNIINKLTSLGMTVK